MADRKLVVVVTGGRNYANRALVDATLDKAKPDTVLHGGATGADRLADEWCQRNGVRAIAFPAQWNALGKAAGPMRNGQMCDTLLEYKADRCRIGVIAFPGAAGTASCVTHAERRGIRIWRPASDDEGSPLTVAAAQRAMAELDPARPPRQSRRS